MSEAAATPALCRLPAGDLLRHIRNGEVSTAEVVEASLTCIAGRDAALHAFVTIDAEGALREAARLDAAAATGRLVGPLHGIPFSVKDLIATAGVRTTRGSLLHKDDVPREDDLVVARLRAAGAVMIGKTNTPEFGFGALCSNSIAGSTANPYDTDRTSGGSSGGAAVAVAAGMVPLSLGTDFGGSVRTPAAFCNVVGLRPGAGVVPKATKAMLWETMATYGTVTRTVGDARLMLSVMAGGDPRDPPSIDNRGLRSATAPSSAPLRLAASLDLGIAAISHEIADAFAGGLARLAAEGFEVEAADLNFAGAQQAFETLRAAMLFHDFAGLLDRPGFDPSPTLQWNVERGRSLSAESLCEAEAIRYRLYQSALDFFDRYDFLLLPATSVPPFPLSQTEVIDIDGRPLRNIIDYLTITYAISLIGLPAISIPGGWSIGGLPVGLQIVAGPRRELELLSFAERLERECGFGHSFPEDRN
jgi:amidase